MYDRKPRNYAKQLAFNLKKLKKKDAPQVLSRPGPACPPLGTLKEGVSFFYPQMTAPGEPTFFPSASAKCLRGHMEPVTSEDLHLKSQSLGTDTVVGLTQRRLLGEVCSQWLRGTRVQRPDTAVGGGKRAISVASGVSLQGRLLCVGKNKNKQTSFLQTSCKAEPPGANMRKKGQWLLGSQRGSPRKSRSVFPHPYQSGKKRGKERGKVGKAMFLRMSIGGR